MYKNPAKIFRTSIMRCTRKNAVRLSRPKIFLLTNKSTLIRLSVHMYTYSYKIKCIGRDNYVNSKTGFDCNLVRLIIWAGLYGFGKF
jgi:hypothetical protein